MSHSRINFISVKRKFINWKMLKRSHTKQNSYIDSKNMKNALKKLRSQIRWLPMYT